MKLICECSFSGLPEPRFVVLGEVQAGKSTLANALLGKVDIPPCRSCAFKTCNGNHACTQETTYSHAGLWLGEDIPFTVVDNPGFATLVKDSNNDEDISWHYPLNW